MVFTYCSKSTPNIGFDKAILARLLSLLLLIGFCHLFWILSCALKHKWSFDIDFSNSKVGKDISHKLHHLTEQSHKGPTQMLLATSLFLITVMEPKTQAIPISPFPVALCTGKLNCA